MGDVVTSGTLAKNELQVMGGWENATLFGRLAYTSKSQNF